jgi:lipopolysaccharide transport system ATP-binding protein
MWVGVGGAMSGPAIRVENLGKMYWIGGPVERYKTLRDSLSGAVAGIGRRVRGWFGGENGAGGKYETIWALKDVTFEVQPGEVVGIIGRNGAGKSTLLKILSRITEPTTGRVEIRGRVASLLEVGTGFHPELTGRENVYLNGAILGMKRAEVDRKFDEIVAFAEVEKFIDTPVKHYSSGMYVRLAFSVAAHLDTDILLVDEVLSVGDVKFQQKCMGKMQDRAFADKTILFVSHNLPAVAQFCERAILLENGGMKAYGATSEVLQRYLGATEARASADLGDAPRRVRRLPGSGCLRRITLKSGGVPTSVFEHGQPMQIEVEIECCPELEGQTVNLGIALGDALGRNLFGFGTREFGKSPVLQGGRVRFGAELEKLLLMPGRYGVNLYLGDSRGELEVIEQSVFFDVVWAPVEGVVRPPVTGMYFHPVSWTISSAE